MKLLVSALCVFIASINYSQAQFMPISVLNDDVRREQLLGNFDSTVSFTLMPFVSAKLNSRIFSDSSEHKFRNHLFTERGLRVESYQHNKDFYNSAFASETPERKWRDVIIMVHGDWNYKNLILTAHL